MSQTKVQGYLNKHKISNLFELMMSSLVMDMPADPYDHLISLIQENKTKSYRNTVVEAGDSKAITSVWASTDMDYDKPWRTNSKLTTKGKKPAAEAPNAFSRKEWDKTVKLTNKTFDELGTGKQDKMVEKKALRHVDPDVSDVFQLPLDSVDNPSMTEEELLKKETVFSAKQTLLNAEKDELAETVPKTHPKKKGPKADSAKHQKQLAEFIEEKRAAMDADSGISDDCYDEDFNGPAVYVAEDLADLADEGVNVKNLKSIRSKTVIKPPFVSTEPVINVSICANCAKVMHANEKESNDGASQISFGSTSTQKSTSSKHSKTTAKSSHASRVSDVWRTHRTDPLNVTVQNPQLDNSKQVTTAKPAVTAFTPQPTSRGYLSTSRTGFSSYYATADDDDEFESVSQVSADHARMPVWGADVNEEDLSPVKGASMLSSPRTPAVVKPKSADIKKRLAVTLKEDLLRQLPQKSDTVEDFLAGKTWSGEKLAETNVKKDMRRSYDPSAARLQPASQKSYDFLSGVDKNTGWKIDYNSDGESTLVP